VNPEPVNAYPFSFYPTPHHMIENIKGMPATCPPVPGVGRRASQREFPILWNSGVRIPDFGNRKPEAGGHLVLMIAA